MAQFYEEDWTFKKLAVAQHRYEITHQEIVNYPGHITSIKELMLMILQDKGAPIEGKLLLRVRDGWEYEAVNVCGAGLVFVFYFYEVPLKRKPAAKKDKTEVTIRLHRHFQFAIALIILAMVGVKLWEQWAPK